MSARVTLPIKRRFGGALLVRAPLPGASRANQQVDGGGAGRGWRLLWKLMKSMMNCRYEAYRTERCNY